MTAQIRKVLVFDDKKENLGTAQRVLNRRGLRYFLTQDDKEAQDYIRENHSDLDLVITDLFAPSKTDYRELLKSDLEAVRDYLEKLQGGEQAVNPGIPEDYVKDGERVAKSLKHLSGLRRKLDSLDENPSGLGVAEKSIEYGVPYRVLTFGNRHQGKVAEVREATSWSPKWIGQVKSSGFPDPLYQMTGMGETNGDKTQEDTWEKALDGKLDEDGNRIWMPR